MPRLHEPPPYRGYARSVATSRTLHAVSAHPLGGKGNRMTRQLITLFSLVFGLVLASSEGADHVSHSQNPTIQPTPAPFSLSLSSGSNQALKTQMDSVLATVTDLENSKQPSALTAKKAGKKIDSAVNEIFRTCKLPPDLDSAIHPLLAEILKGATALKKGQREVGLQKLKETLEIYQQRFQFSAPQKPE